MSEHTHRRVERRDKTIILNNNNSTAPGFFLGAYLGAFLHLRFSDMHLTFQV